MYKFKFADIGEGIHEGTILKWLVKEQDIIKEGDTLVIVETDKVNAELPSPVNGKVAKIHFKEGDDIHVGDVIIEIDDGKETPKKEETPKETVKEGSAGVVGEIDVSDEMIQAPTTKASTNEVKILASPVARKMASDLNIKIEDIKGTGPLGRVLKDDVLAYQRPSEKPAITNDILGDEVIKISRHRRAISNAMITSKQQIPHTVLFDEVVVNELVEFRNKVKEMANQEGIKLTYMAFISKAVIIALSEFRVFNASYNEPQGEIHLYKDINLGIAVDTESGLVVPNIKNAKQYSVFGLAKEIDVLASKALSKTLALEEQQQGTFTITNFGSVGVPYGTPIINYPEVAILGIGKIDKKPIIVDNIIEVGYVLPLSLAVDHRIIDGADAGRFLHRLKELLHNPTLLLLT
ncbi:MAG: dihydrolipoamide acetyltransferase family protein [Acholeplasmataceae bacterium]